MRALSNRDKSLLASFVTVYLDLPVPGQALEELNQWDELSRTARKSITCAKRIREALDSQFGQALKFSPPLKSTLERFGDLPSRLETFGLLLGGLLDRLVGKQGQKNKLVRNKFLIMASEFVRLRTNKYNDEHLAELIQALSNASELADFSGDAIHKKRMHLKKAYPLIYAHLFNTVKEIADRSLS